MKCRWCTFTTAGLCYKHWDERRQFWAAVRTWTFDLVIVAVAAWTYATLLAGRR